MSVNANNTAIAAGNADARGSSCLGTVFVTLVLGIMSLAVLSAALGGGSGSLAFSKTECAISGQFPLNVTRWCRSITTHARQNNLPPDLVAALIWLESGGNAIAYSQSGAVGLMQVMPRDGLAADFVCSGKPCFAQRPSIRELRNPEYNIQYGTQMLQSLVAKHGGNYREALREYGPIDVGYSYADDVLSLYRRYGE